MDRCNLIICQQAHVFPDNNGLFFLKWFHCELSTGEKQDKSLQILIKKMTEDYTLWRFGVQS